MRHWPTPGRLASLLEPWPPSVHSSVWNFVLVALCVVSVSFHIRILSLNTTWNLNKSEIYRIPVLKNIFLNENFMKQSITEDKELEDINFISNHKYIKKDHYIILEDIFEANVELIPTICNLLKDIKWIFNDNQKDWCVSKKRTYQLLNPTFEFEESKKFYKCINCKIIVDNLEGSFEEQDECQFHPERIIVKRNYGKITLCGSCGYDYTSINTNLGCKKLKNHVFKEILI